jgi:GR25 family glycosyltransferase involved in LPS biosynthesis
MLDNINIYYINLKKSTDRNHNMQEQFKHMNTIFKNKIIKGIDGNTEDLDEYILINKEYYKSSNLHDNASLSQEIKQRQIACLSSHLYAIKAAYDDGLSEVIISEDDINLKILNFSHNKLGNLWSQNKDADIIQLYSSSLEIIPHYTESIKNKNLKLIPHKYGYWGCCAYLINRNGMEKIVNYFDETQKKFNLLDISLNVMLVSDNFIYGSCNTVTSSLPFINILNPENNKSTIGINTNNQKLINKYRSILEIEHNKSRRFSLTNPMPEENLNITKTITTYMNNELNINSSNIYNRNKHFYNINYNTNIIIKIINKEL